MLHDAKRTVTGKRHKYEYKCSACGNYFKQTDVQVDHTIPAGTLKDYNDLPKFVERLFVAKDELSVMCKPCHTIKSNKEKTDAK